MVLSERGQDLRSPEQPVEVRERVLGAPVCVQLHRAAFGGRRPLRLLAEPEDGGRDSHLELKEV